MGKKELTDTARAVIAKTESITDEIISKECKLECDIQYLKGYRDALAWVQTLMEEQSLKSREENVHA